MVDPTNTRQIRDDFTRDVVGRFRVVRGRVRHWAGYNEDMFEQARLARVDPDELPEPLNVLRADGDHSKIREFARWLQDTVAQAILEQTRPRAVRAGDHWTATYLRAGYERGWRNARSRLRNEGVNVGSSVDAVFNLPTPRKQLRRMYTRKYGELEDITTEMVPTIRRELTDGLRKGENPRKIADRLTSELQSIEKARAVTLARTAVIESYSEATLDRYERAGVDTVAHGEWRTANDSRVCPICESLEGREIPIGEARTGTFEFEPDDDQPDHLAGTYPLRPPAHPRGRCTLLPVLT